MNGYNILITNMQAMERTDRRALESGVRAVVRYRYSQELDDNRNASITIWAFEEFDAAAKNAAGNLGAFVPYIRRADINSAITRLRAEWGDIPVQINLSASKIRD